MCRLSRALSFFRRRSAKKFLFPRMHAERRARVSYPGCLICRRRRKRVQRRQGRKRRTSRVKEKEDGRKGKEEEEGERRRFSGEAECGPSMLKEGAQETSVKSCRSRTSGREEAAALVFCGGFAQEVFRVLGMHADADRHVWSGCMYTGKRLGTEKRVVSREAENEYLAQLSVLFSFPEGEREAHGFGRRWGSSGRVSARRREKRILIGRKGERMAGASYAEHFVLLFGTQLAGGVHLDLVCQLHPHAIIVILHEDG